MWTKYFITCAVLELTVILQNTCLCTARNTVNHVTTIEWFRTAKYTNDRLTKQADIIFGEDFHLDQMITITR